MRLKAVRCADWWERKPRGLRYVTARGQCTRLTAHPSGYCKPHRYSYRWNEAQEAEYQRAQREVYEHEAHERRMGR
jgi:hypothetical protein